MTHHGWDAVLEALRALGVLALFFLILYGRYRIYESRYDGRKKFKEEVKEERERDKQELAQLRREWEASQLLEKERQK